MKHNPFTAMTRLTPISQAALALFVLGMGAPTFAQAVGSSPPNAGQIVREPQAPPEPPRSATSVRIPEAATELMAPGGANVVLDAIGFDGNTLIASEQLLTLVQDAVGKSHDLAGIYALAERVSAHYRERGYGFAKAFVPKDGFSQGMLTLYVAEGRLGAIHVGANNGQTAQQAAAVLAPLKQAPAIYVPDLERQVLLLGDRPGYTVVPTLKPGEETGTGDLDVQLTRTAPARGGVSLSNHGNRYTGNWLTRVTGQFDSPFVFGDQLVLGATLSDRHLTVGTLSYGLPLSESGLRGTVGHSRTGYSLGREFAHLGATGQADVSTLGLSYPLLRSLSANATVLAQGQRKRFFDEQASVSLQERRSSQLGTLQLQFDRTDATGVTYGQLELAIGSLAKNGTDTAREVGNFARGNWDLTRLQRVSEQTTLSLRWSGQLASRNLNSSEGFGLGGANAVRAFPSGEGSGDQGGLVQLELRHRSTPECSPFVFYDAGRVTLEKAPTAVGSNSRMLSGAGVGTRYQRGAAGLDAVLAMPLAGGNPQSDPSKRHARLWVQGSYAF